MVPTHASYRPSDWLIFFMNSRSHIAHARSTAELLSSVEHFITMEHQKSRKRRRSRQTMNARNAMKASKEASSDSCALFAEKHGGEDSVVLQTEETGHVSNAVGVDNDVDVIVLPAHSTSASKIRRFPRDGNLIEEAEQPRSWVIAECTQLTALLADVHCPDCDGNVSIKVSQPDSMGFADKLLLQCSDCNFQREKYSSPKLNNHEERRNVGFEINKHLVLYTHEIGSGFSSLEKLRSVLGMSGMCKSSYHRLDSEINDSIVRTTDATLDETAQQVKEAYGEIYPGVRPDNEDQVWEEDNIQWVDVSFDGTWQKRGFSSHHGVGFVVDTLTGYVLDYDVLSTYCHVCTMNQEKLGNMTPEQQEDWRQDHQPSCQINHHGSAKAMEREIALTLWNRSVERHNLRYRTMLSDGDSLAFNSVRDAMPYGPERPVTKLDCINHVHKRMGTALQRTATDARLGGRGEGRLTAHKVRRLQHYFRGALLSNLGDIEAMSNAVWASVLHATSTDEDPHHGRCPEGVTSWCFYNRSVAEGRPIPPHREHTGTALSREVFQALIPLYRRMASPALMQKVSHGKTQNNNESLHNLLWNHCPKEVFVGRRRLTAATAEAASKFNRGNSQVAQVLHDLELPNNLQTTAALEALDLVRISKAERATAAAHIARRRNHRANRQHHLAEQEELEGVLYGAGILGNEE